MTAQPGSLMLMKIGDGGDPEIFSLVAGLRSTRMILNNALFPASTIESGSWRTLCVNMGEQSLTVIAEGLFTDSEAEATVRNAAFNQSIYHYQISFGNGDIVSGPFLISSYERSGDYDEEELVALTLESAGVVSYTPA